MQPRGSYTCVGLSLVEIFFHAAQEPLVSPDAAEDTVVENRGATETITAVPMPKARQSAAQLAPLGVAWAKVEGVCSENYTKEANLRMSLQRESVSAQTTHDQQ